MEKDVIISIRGTQDYSGTDPDTMELVTEGKLAVQDGALCLSYEESELTGMEGTTTVFQVEPEKVTLLRLGSVQSEMVFEEGRRHMSLYSTPYGNMEIGVRARRLNSTLELTGGRLEIDYDIEINHMLAGQSLFRIDVRENTPVKS
ncbi:MAG: DUF1934 domain-containing protein [Oscillospiraceae bacterium]|nr:DUF1934 domain-containing protein [Eubacteriales bacterium]MDY2617386.1 DUF1934 domain-containing protein [Oscillospiraceae bacterium]